MAKLSLCMIVKDEEKNLPGCLECIKEVVDEIVIVDTGSTDNTIKIAKDYGAKVYYFDWCDDFSAARNESLKYATGDYILYLDADDRLEKEDVKKLVALKKDFSPAKNEVFYFKLVNLHENGHKESCYQLRIFPNLKELRFKGRVHEQIGPAVKRLGLANKLTNICLYHTGYRDPSLNHLKAKRNLELLLKDLEENPNAYIHYYLGQTYFYLGDFQKAKDFFKKVLIPEAKTECPWMYITSGIQLGNIYLKEGAIQKNISLLENLYREFPDNDVIRLFLGQSYLMANRPQDSLNTLLLVNPERLTLLFVPISEKEYRAFYYLKLADAYARLKYLRLAEGSYQKALEILPDNLKLLIDLGKLNLQMGEKQKAMEYFKRALKISGDGPRKSQIYTLLGVISIEGGGLEQAESYFNKALNLFPFNFRAAVHLAELKIEKNCLPQAQRILEKVLPFCKNGMNLYIMSMLSFVYTKQCMIEKCIQMADKMLKALSLPRNLVLNSLLDLAKVYKNIAQILQMQNKNAEADIILKTTYAIYGLMKDTELFLASADLIK